MPRRMTTGLSNHQKRLLHIWPRELGLDDDVRRDVQREQVGKESCKDMTYHDFLVLKQHYGRLGARIRGGRSSQASKSLRALYAKIERRGDRQGKATVAQLKKIVRMLDLPIGKEEEFLNRALKGHVGVVRWTWLDPRHAHHMIEALKARRQRRSA